jgi:hypothetical protein
VTAAAILGLLTFPDADALRDHLDALNEDGESPVAVGIDNSGQPFLITLVGPYVESEDVLFDSPWHNDRDYGERINGVWVPHPPRCNECRAYVHEMRHLRFPVTVMTSQSVASYASVTETAQNDQESSS